MRNIEEKKKHWKSIKSPFMEMIPKEYTVIVKGLEDDSEYYHPCIKINNEIEITSQCDLNSNHIYALRIKLTKGYEYGAYIHEIGLELNDDLPRILNNFNLYETRINEAFDRIKKLIDIEDTIGKLKSEILNESISKFIDDDIKKSQLECLYKLTEDIENNRLFS